MFILVCFYVGLAIAAFTLSSTFYLLEKFAEPDPLPGLLTVSSRAMILSWIWPVVLVVGAIYLIPGIIKDARGGSNG